MRTRLLLSVTFIIAFGFAQPSFAQQISRGLATTPVATSPSPREVAVGSTFHSEVLPESIQLAGADFTNVSGWYDHQSNGGPLHNIQVDPSNPKRIHAAIMSATASPDPSDTVGGNYPSRRTYYTFSSNAGVTWSTPVVLGGTRTGYPNMILYKRGADYVPVIAVHQVISEGSTNLVSMVYLETGAPGAGNFVGFPTDRSASNGKQEDLIWPAIAISKDSSTLYVAGDMSSLGTATVKYGPMEFGSFKFAADGKSLTWNGWKTEPGGKDSLGFSYAGKKVIHVAENGTIGIFYAQPDTTHHGLYFVESTDGGTTWKNIYSPLMGRELADNTLGGSSYMSDNGLDFIYQNSVPNFFWIADAQILKSNTFYPLTAGLYYWKPGMTTVSSIVSLSNFSPTPVHSTTLRINGQDLSINFLDSANYFTGLPAGSLADPQGEPLFSLPTLARTSASEWAVFYQTYTANDTLDMQVADPVTGKEQVWYFNSIYQQVTTDAGATWSQPKVYIGNDPNAADADKRDFRFPETSDFNPNLAGDPTYHTLFSVDTMAGSFQDAAYPGYSENSWYHKALLHNAVSSTQPTTFSLAQNYPNPFNPSTTIKFTLVNSANVEIKVTDMLGRTVATILNARVAAGPHSVKFDGGNLASGVYSYTMKANGQSFTQRMVLSK